MEHQTNSEQYVYTCISCRFQFNSFDEQREHFKSELHRFNLKRKAFDLPPVTYEQFLAKVEALKKEEEKEAQAAAASKSNKLECRICDKKFSSEGTYNHHLQSKKHKDNVAAGVTERVRKPKEEKPVESSTENTIKEPETLEEAEKMMEEKIRNAKSYPEEMCFFCNHMSTDIESNVTHMLKTHSFFIPNIEYLSDLKGLLRYLSDKICIGNICLYCNGKGRYFKDRDSCQDHMRSLSHCKLNFETEEDEDEYDEFYDFTSQYPDVEFNEDGTPKENPEQRSIVRKDQEIVYNGHQITFADGLTIGHRDYAVYYKQRFYRANERISKIRNIISQYKLLGYHEKPKTQFELDKKAQRRDLTLSIKIGMKKNTQRFYKNQLLVQ